eukprot:125797-Pyramimonas_sp.AAC.1
MCLAVRHSQIWAACRFEPRRPRAHARFHSLRPPVRFRVGGGRETKRASATRIAETVQQLTYMKTRKETGPKELDPPASCLA